MRQICRVQDYDTRYNLHSNYLHILFLDTDDLLSNLCAFSRVRNSKISTSFMKSEIDERVHCSISFSFCGKVLAAPYPFCKLEDHFYQLSVTSYLIYVIRTYTLCKPSLPSAATTPLHSTTSICRYFTLQSIASIRRY